MNAAHWQAMFACQIGIKPYEERLQLKWGFSPAFLLEEAFVITSYSIHYTKLYDENNVDITEIESEDGVVTLMAAAGDLDNMKDALTSLGKELNFLEDKVTYLAQDYIELSEEDLNKFNSYNFV